MLVAAAPAMAGAQHDTHAPASESWTWTLDANVFLSANLQERRFRDFHQVESQNWVMGVGLRGLGAGTLALHGMLSFEPFTLRDLGSSQAFQTGETFGGAPLIDYQHPHDLFMALAAAYERPIGRAQVGLRGGLVDAPALGPTAFMHRASSALHPTAPLAHHQLDSAHISHGVVTASLRAGAWQVEASAFRGREPDEDRLDLDLGALDSAAVRARWSRRGTRAQVSVGRLNEPEAAEPGDVTRITASLEHSWAMATRVGAVTAAWGRNHKPFSNEDAWLLEAALPALARGTGYLRAEFTDKHILEAGGLHPPGLDHGHTISRVAALTTGYQQELWRHDAWAWSVGGDVTGHLVPRELSEAYGRPVSFHIYSRLALRGSH